MKEKKNHIDRYIFVAVIALMIFSISAVYSASSTFAMMKKNDFNFYFRLHLIKVVASIFILFVGMKINYHFLLKMSKKILILAVLSLIVLFVVSGAIKGATRWFGLSMLSFQPAEFAKYALVFHIAVLLSQKEEFLTDFKRGFLPFVFWISIVVILILIQPNFSTGLMICIITFTMLFIGKLRFSHIWLIILSSIPVLIIYVISAEYRMKRILAFIGKGESNNFEHVNYQAQQGIIGFGNGGLFGVGPGQSKQRDLFLPESYGDFIYAIIGEEYGFIGATIILLVFCLIMIRGFKIAKHAPDSLGKYLAVGITSTVSLYAIINAGVACGLFPTTGLPMPFLSYGGSSMFFTAFAVGLLLNISTFTNIRPRVQVAESTNEEPIVGQVFN
jgi:cell division protein FtsW